MTKRTHRPDPKPGLRPRKRIRVVDPKAITNARIMMPSCALCGQRPVTAHHVVPKGSPHFGDDVIENLVTLCGHGTRGCHGDVEHKRSATLGQLGVHLSAQRPDVVAYVRGKIDHDSDDWFRRTFGVTL